MGCDYCEGIKGVGPKRAFELIQNYRDIETILENIDRNKFTVPENWNYQVARELFINPEVADPQEIEVIKNLVIKIMFEYSLFISLSIA